MTARTARFQTLPRLAIRCVTPLLFTLALGCGNGAAQDDMATGSGRADLAKAASLDMAMVAMPDLAPFTPFQDMPMMAPPDLTPDTFTCSEWLACSAKQMSTCAEVITSARGQMLLDALTRCANDVCAATPPCMLGTLDILKCQACQFTAAQNPKACGPQLGACQNDK